MNTIEQLLAEKNNDIWTISPDDSVYDAVKQMSEKSIGALPVVINNELVGIISERDYARKVILEDRRSKETLVKEIMTTRVFHVSPGQKIEDCMAIMTEHRVRHLPVVTDGKLSGMISVGDVVKHIILDQKIKIEDLEHSLSWGESY